MVYTGIDWSDQAHDFCILDEAGQKLETFRIAHGENGFESAHRRIARHAGPDDVRVAIETKDSLLVDFLCELGYTLYFLNPKQTDRFRDRHRMSHSRSDGFDAYVLADAVRTDPHKFNALSPLDGPSLELRVLTRAREKLIGRKVAIHNELTADLKRYFPAALKILGGVDNQEAISFLLEYPTCEQARTLSVARIASILSKKGGVSEKTAQKHAQKAHALLEEPQMTPSAEVARAYPLAVKSLLRQMHNVLEELAALEQEIATSYLDHPNHQLIDAIPGFAKVTGPTASSEIGAELARFAGLKDTKGLHRH